MPLSPPASRRALSHTRAIQVAAFQREDGLWDIDAHLTDIKTRAIELADGLRPAGAPIHDLWLRLTIDTTLTVVEVEAVSDAVPYQGHCDTIGPDYRQLIGLNLRKAFRNRVRERVGGTAACSHLTELAQILPTIALQAFAGLIIPNRDSGEAGAAKPFQLDHCHALRSDGAVVAKYYPRWAVRKPAGAET